MNDKPQTIVIVGGVAGGASAATRARRMNEHARIIMYEKDGYVSFANCGLPYYIGGEIQDREKLLVAKPELFRNRFNIEVQTRHEVLSIDRKKKVVRVLNRDAGEEFEQSYDKLILAPGASPIVPPMDGKDAPNVFTLRNVEDTDRIKSWMEENKPERAVIVGAGFIGLEMVEQLHEQGIQTSLVELLDQVLPPLDPEMSRFVQKELEDHGIDLHLGDGIENLRVENDRATGVILKSGAVLEADAVILGIGVRPNLKLAQDAGLEIGAGGGMDVNDYFQTSDPDIYAVGDAVEYRHRLMPQRVRVPLAGPANRAGRIAGEHAATGSARPMRPVLGTAIVRVFGKAAAITGLSTKAARRAERPSRSVVIVANNHAGYYPGAESMVLKVIYDPDTGKVLGAQAVGGEGVDKRIDVVAAALHFDGTVYDLAGFDLAYAPPYGSAKDPVHMAAFAACNDLDGITPLAEADADLEGRQVVDVRTDKEVAAMHIPGSIHIPVDSLRERISELDPNLPTTVTCQSGLRAHVATRVLRQHGFSDVNNLSGGMLVHQHVRPGTVVKPEAETAKKK